MGMLGKLLDRFRQKGPSRPRSKAETEKRRRLLIVLLIVLAVVSSVSVVGYGYYDTNVKPWHEPILKVNGTVFDMRYFVNMMRLSGATSSEYAQYVVSGMEESELMRQGLEDQFGVDIGAVTSDEAVEAFLRPIFVSNGKISDNATEDEYQQVYRDWVADWTETYGISEKDLIDLGIKPSLISEELQKQIGDAQYPATDNYEHAQVQALLVTGSDNATLMRTRWENGEAFDTLAEDESVSASIRDTGTDNATANWVARGIKSVAFDNYTFSATPGVLSEPIQDSDSSGKYWVIKVLATEWRQLSDTDRDTLVGEAFDKWLEEAKNSGENEIVNYLNEEGGTAKLAWAVDHATVSTS